MNVPMGRIWIIKLSIFYNLRIKFVLFKASLLKTFSFKSEKMNLLFPTSVIFECQI
jgi:hypothetical protein